MKTFFKENLENIILIIGAILIVAAIIATGILISSLSERSNSTIYTNDNKSYNISEDSILTEKSEYLEIKKDDKIIRIPWDNISSWEYNKETNEL